MTCTVPQAGAVPCVKNPLPPGSHPVPAPGVAATVIPSGRYVRLSALLHHRLAAAVSESEPVCRRPHRKSRRESGSREHCIRGLSNADIRGRLESTSHLRDINNNPNKQSAKVSRILSRFHTHKLIAKIPHSRRWRVTDNGRQIMAASLCLRDVAFPELFRKNITD